MSTVRKGKNLFGWISAEGCQNPACKRAIREGRTLHAIPAGFAVTLPDYHFATEREARKALLTCSPRVEI